MLTYQRLTKVISALALLVKCTSSFQLGSKHITIRNYPHEHIRGKPSLIQTQAVNKNDKKNRSTDDDLSKSSTIYRLKKAPNFKDMKTTRFLGVLRHLRKDATKVIDRHALYCEENNLPGVLMNLGLLGKLYYIIDPEAVQYIMEDRRNIFYKSHLDRRGVGLLTGTGVLLSDGADHTRKRRLILPSFDSKSLEGFISVMEESALDFLSMQQQQQNKNKKGAATSIITSAGNTETVTIDVMKSMQSLAMKIVAKCLFTEDITEGREISNQIDKCLEHVVHVTRRPINPPLWMPTKRNRRFRRALKVLDDKVANFTQNAKDRQKNLQEANNGASGKSDLLTMFLAARYENEEDGSSSSSKSSVGAGLSDAELRDEVMTLFLAGHDTTALALSWTLWFISDPKNSVWIDRIRREYDQIQASGGFNMRALQDPEAMKYTRAVICESLRCRPPSYAVDREVQEDTILPGGIQVKKKDIILLAPISMHRSSKHFDDPEEWRPDRFLEWNSNDPWDGPFSRSVYMPFGNGRKRCIGWRFAQWELLVILSTIVKRVDIQRMPGQDELKGRAEITLRPEEGYQLNFEFSEEDQMKDERIAENDAVKEGITVS